MSLKMLGLSADGRLAVPQSTGDVKSWDTYFAPDDDIHGVIVAGLKQAAHKGAECHSSQYGFTDQDIADLFVKLAKSPRSRFLFDKVQEAGPKERPIVEALLKHMSAAQWCPVRKSRRRLERTDEKRSAGVRSKEIRPDQWRQPPRNGRPTAQRICG